MARARVQFGRDWRLEVKAPGGRVKTWQPDPEGSIRFEVEQGITRGMDRARIVLANRNPESRGFLTQEGLEVFLFAGYSDDLALIFAGQVAKKGVRTSVVETRERTTRTTTIEAGTGEISLQDLRFDESYRPGVTSTQILQSIATTLGARLQGKDALPSVTYETGWSHHGRVGGALDQVVADLAGDAGEAATWTLQNTSLIVLSQSQTTGESAEVVSQGSGLLGRVTVQTNGLEFTSRLNSRLRPGRRAVVESEDASGTYKLTKVTHTGDYERGPWVSKCFCAFVGGQAS